jgi:hypothetical protein
MSDERQRDAEPNIDESEKEEPDFEGHRDVGRDLRDGRDGSPGEAARDTMNRDGRDMRDG